MVNSPPPSRSECRPRKRHLGVRRRYCCGAATDAPPLSVAAPSLASRCCSQSKRTASPRINSATKQHEATRDSSRPAQRIRIRVRRQEEAGGGFIVVDSANAQRSSGNSPARVQLSQDADASRHLNEKSWTLEALSMLDDLRGVQSSKLFWPSILQVKEMLSAGEISDSSCFVGLVLRIFVEIKKRHGLTLQQESDVGVAWRAFVTAVKSSFWHPSSQEFAVDATSNFSTSLPFSTQDISSCDFKDDSLCGDILSDEKVTSISNADIAAPSVSNMSHASDDGVEMKHFVNDEQQLVRNVQRTDSTDTVVLEEPDYLVQRLRHTLGCTDVQHCHVFGAQFNASAVAAKGRFKNVNQDRICLHHGSSELIFGVFDGHGILGENAAALCAKTVPPLVLSSLSCGSSDTDITELCASALLQANETLLEVAQNEYDFFSRTQHSLDKSFIHFDYGTTAFVAVLRKRMLYFAWVGDSDAVLFESLGSSFRSIALTKAHRLHENSAERARIAACDLIDTNPPKRSRSFNTSKNHRLFPAHLDLEESKKFGLNLNMSRSLGHRVLSQHGIVATPETGFRSLSKRKHYFVVCASDGVWDQMPMEQMALILEKLQEHTVDEIVAAILTCCDQGWQESCAGDNFGVCCIQIPKSVKESPPSFNLM